MKAVVVGGTGRLGSLVVAELRLRGHEVVAAAPSTGIDAVTGRGLAAALDGAAVVVDASNPPTFEDADVLAHFTDSTRNLLAAERTAGVGHHVLVSIVGADRLPASGYMRAKVAQEALLVGGGVPYTIVRATQFMEFLGTIADAATVDGVVRLPAARLRPIAVADLAEAVADVADGAPVGGMVEVAGPEATGLDELVRRVLAASGDPRRVVVDPSATYFGAPLEDGSLLPDGSARLAATRLDDRLALR